MKHVNFDKYATPKGWVRGREWDNTTNTIELAPYIELANSNGNVAVGCFTDSDARDEYDVQDAIDETNGWAWWNAPNREWVSFDTSACKSLKEVCDTVVVLARMGT